MQHDPGRPAPSSLESAARTGLRPRSCRRARCAVLFRRDRRAEEVARRSGRTLAELGEEVAAEQRAGGLLVAERCLPVVREVRRRHVLHLLAAEVEHLAVGRLSHVLDRVDRSSDLEPRLAHPGVDRRGHAVALEPCVGLIDHRVIARPHARRYRELRSVHDDLGPGALEGAGHADVIGMKMRDEDSSHVFDRDARLGKRSAECGLRFLRVHARVDERVTRRALDEIRVDAPQSERERKRDAPDARRDDRSVQRDGSFAKLITGRMVIPRPVRLVA